MPESGEIIEQKVKDFAKDITAFLDNKRDAKAKDLKKKDPKVDVDKTLVKVRFAYSSGKGSISRSPQQQAEYVSGGTSWTCSGAHMIDNARHVLMMLAPPGKKEKASWAIRDAFGSKDEHFVSLSDVKSKWKSLMATHGLKNHKGGDGWGEGDEFHFELPDGKVPMSDSRVQACLAHYAKITRIDGKKRNKKFEDSASWKAALKPHLQKLGKKIEELEEKNALEQLKALQLDGDCRSSEVLMRAVSKTSSATGREMPDIDAPTPLNRGAGSVKKVKASGGFTWDSLARSLFESLGITATSGFDVKLSCSLDYNFVTYENLSQGFMTGLTPSCSVVFNTPAAKALGMTVSVSSDLKLAKSGKAPVGEVVFDFELKSPLDKSKGTITFKIDGSKVSATSKAT